MSVNCPGPLLSSDNGSMRLSARMDYAVRAALELAANEGQPMKSDEIAAAQGIPHSFLENILADLRHAGLVSSQRGAEGGHWLTRPASEIAVADVLRVEGGNLADIHGTRPESVEYEGAATRLREVWVAARTAYRKVLESVTLAEIVSGELPDPISRMLSDPDSWVSHWPPSSS
jgi:Rrf2 family protein